MAMVIDSHLANFQIDHWSVAAADSSAIDTRLTHLDIQLTNLFIVLPCRSHKFYLLNPDDEAICQTNIFY